MVLLIILVGTLLAVLIWTLCVHFNRFQAKIEMPTKDAELIVIVFSDKSGEPLPRTFPEG